MEKEINPNTRTSDGQPGTVRSSKFKKLLAVALAILALVYDVSPVDLIPDVPFIGWIDDLAVSVLAFSNLIKQLKS